MTIFADYEQDCPCGECCYEELCEENRLLEEKVQELENKVQDLQALPIQGDDGEVTFVEDYLRSQS